MNALLQGFGSVNNWFAENVLNKVTLRDVTSATNIKTHYCLTAEEGDELDKTLSRYASSSSIQQIFNRVVDGLYALIGKESTLERTTKVISKHVETSLKGTLKALSLGTNFLSFFTSDVKTPSPEAQDYAVAQFSRSYATLLMKLAITKQLRFDTEVQKNLYLDLFAPMSFSSLRFWENLGSDKNMAPGTFISCLPQVFSAVLISAGGANGSEGQKVHQIVQIFEQFLHTESPTNRSFTGL